MIKIQDVARQAQVSVSTVSRVLSEDPSFSTTEETRMKIMLAVDELGYTPLRRRKSKAGLAVSETTADWSISPDIQQSGFEAFSGSRNSGPLRCFGYVIAATAEEERNDPYFSSIRFGVEKKCAETGLTLTKLIRLNESFSPADLEGLNGLIVVGATDMENIGSLFHYDQHIVLVNNLIDNEPQYDVVSADLARATESAIDTLHQLGHTRIGFMGGTENIRRLLSESSHELPDIRRVAFENRMRRLGLFDESLVHIGQWSSEDAERMTRRMISEGTLPTALVVAADPMSIGVLQALRQAGLRVPEDISVISFDDIEAAAFLNPPLSTIRVQAEEIGKQAVNLLNERFQGRKVPLHVTVLSQLVVRGSFGKAP